MLSSGLGDRVSTGLGWTDAGLPAQELALARSRAAASGWTHDTLDEAHLTEADFNEWVALAQHPIAHPLVALECWRQLCRGDGPLVVHRLRNTGLTVALVPLIRSGRILRCWSAPHHTEVGRVCFAFRGDGREALGVLLDDLLGSGGEMLDVKGVTVGWPTYQALRHAGEQRGLRIVEDVVANVPFKRLDRGWDGFWNSIHAKTRREFGRRERQLEKVGRLEFAEVRGGADLQAVFRECIDVEASGYKGQARTALQFRGRERLFWQRFVGLAARWGILALFTLRLDGRLISFDLCARHNGVLYEFKHGTDVRAGPYSPGSVLHLKLFRREIETAGCQLYDFAGQTYEWKRRWTKDEVPLVRLRVYARTWRGWLAYAAGPGWRRAAKRIPGLVGLVKWLRGGRRRARAADENEASAQGGPVLPEDSTTGD